MKALKTITLIALLLSPLALANHAMVFPQRAILYEQKRIANFKVINRSNDKVRYKISILDRIQDSSGRTKVTEDFTNSAKNNIIFSPRRAISLGKNGKKPIRIKLKNYAALADGEYRSYLQIRTDSTESTEGYKVQLKIGTHIPIIIRKGNLQAQASIEEIKQLNGKLYITLGREGNRSIFGNITVINNGKIIGEIKSAAVYPESNTATYSLKLDQQPTGANITVKFTEDESSGNASASKAFTL